MGRQIPEKHIRFRHEKFRAEPCPGHEREAFCYALDTDYKAIRERGAALYRRFPEEAGY